MFLVVYGENVADNAPALVSEFSYGAELVGSVEELSQAHAYISSLAIAAAQEQIMNWKRVQDLLVDMAGLSPLTGSVSIQNRNMHALECIMDNADHLSGVRATQLVEAGIENRLSALAISQELILIDDYDGGMLTAQNTPYMDEEGLQLRLTDDGFRHAVYEVKDQIKEGYFTEEEIGAIADMPITHHASQYALVKTGMQYILVNELEHESVGTVDSDGSYIPYATILSAQHPARASDQ